MDYSTKFYTESFHPSAGEVLPLYKPYRYVPPQREGFLHRFGLKTGIDFARFGLESGMVFKVFLF